jgi:hypothetical protein
VAPPDARGGPPPDVEHRGVRDVQGGPPPAGAHRAGDRRGARRVAVRKRFWAITVCFNHKNRPTICRV